MKVSGIYIDCSALTPYEKTKTVRLLKYAKRGFRIAIPVSCSKCD